MGSNILITGAAGFIGGSLVADFLASNNTLIKNQHIIAAVRSEEQAKALSKLGVNVLQLDLTDEKAVVDSVLHHNIRIIIHTASSLNPRLPLNLVTALSKQREVSGEQTYLIHTSGVSAFYESTGWPSGATKDTQIFDLEKKFADSFPIRKTDVAVIEEAKARGVTSFIVIPPTVYGKGTGQWNQLSVVFPLAVKAYISQKKVYRFAEDRKVSGVHISDLTALYGRILEKVLQKQPPPSGPDGYYFAIAHDIFWWETLDRLAEALHARGLVPDTKLEIWPSDKFAAEALGLPEYIVGPFFNDGENIISSNSYSIGWEPAWTKDRFLRNIDDEIQAVVELGKAKSSLIDSLFTSEA